VKTKPQRHIVAMGGGGFAMEPENPLLDEFVLGLTRKHRPKICFVPTASADSDNFVMRFFRAFAQHPCLASFLPLFKRDIADLRSFLLSQDVIYVSGGNTANMLAVWRVHGVDRILREAWNRGVVLCGLSAGMICWFEESCTDSYGPLAALHDGLGFIKGSACPHYDGERLRRPTFQRLIAEGHLSAGVAADCGAALHFVGTKLAEAVSSRPDAKAYRVTCSRGRAIESAISTRFLRG